MKMIVEEKYHIFERGNDICQYGVFGLTREYSRKSDTVQHLPAAKTIAIDIPPPKTNVMQINVTSACNLVCDYCSFKANAPAGMNEKLTNEETDHWIDVFNRDIGEDGLMIIAGGEPELERETVNRLIEQTGGKKIIFTNGVLIDRSRLRYFLEKNVGLIFSLDGDEFAHASKRKGGPDSYDKIHIAMLTARDVGYDFGISTVVGDHNIDNLSETVEYFHHTYNPASIGLNLPHKAEGTMWDRRDEYAEALMEIFTYAKSNGLFIDQLNRRLTPLVRKKFRIRDCAAQNAKIVVFPGMITTNCVNQAGLHKDDFDWSLRIPLTDEICKDCYAIGICGGGCIFDGEVNGSIGNFDERNCHYTRKILEFMVWDLYDELGENSNNFDKIMDKYGCMIERDQKYKFSVGHEYE